MSTITISSTGSRSSLEQCGAGMNRLRCGWWAHSDFSRSRKQSMTSGESVLSFSARQLCPSIFRRLRWISSLGIDGGCSLPFASAIWLETLLLLSLAARFQVKRSRMSHEAWIFWEKTGTLETHPGTFEKCLGQSRHFSDPFWQTFWECLRNVWVSHGQPTKFW